MRIGIVIRFSKAAGRERKEENYIRKERKNGEYLNPYEHRIYDRKTRIVLV